MGIIKELQDAVRETGLSERQVAKDSGVPQQMINRFMADKQGVTLKTAERLCTYLDLHLHKRLQQ